MDNSKLKILVVEDDILCAKLAEINLSQLDCDVTIARTGAEAINVFNQYQYDLIFMDLGLPDTDGLIVAETIRKQEEKTDAHVPIVSLTAHISDEIKRRVFAAGMDDFLSKPLTADNVQIMLDRYLKKEVASKPNRKQSLP